MYANHNHAYDEIHQEHHDQNREIETKREAFQSIENKVLSRT